MMTRRPLLWALACHLLVTTAALAQDLDVNLPEGDFAGATEGLSINTQTIANAIDELVAFVDEAIAENPDALDTNPDVLAVAELLDQLVDLYEPGDLTQPALEAALIELSPVAYGATTLLDIEISRATLNTQLSYLNERRAGRSWSSSGAASASLGTLGPAFAAPQEEEGPASAATSGAQRLWGGYVKGYGLLSDIDSDDERIGIDDADTFGIQVGVDRLFGDHVLAGLMVGYGRSYGDFDDDLGDIDVDTWQIGGYASMDFDRWYVDVSLTYGGGDWDTKRDMPSLGRRADADFDGWNLTTYVGGGYRFDLPNRWTLAPTLAFVYSYFDYDGFTESGAGAADLVVDDRDTDSFRSRLGARLVLADLATGPTWVPDVAIGWEHEFEDPDDIDARFAVAGSPFSVGTGDFDEDAMYLGVGVSWLPRSNVTGSLRYEGLYGSDTSSHAVIGGISLRF